MIRPSLAIMLMGALIGAFAVRPTAAISPAPQQNPTFRGATESVSVYATVTDRDGRLVPNLQKDDFQILDDKAPQPITVFENAVTPFTAVVMLDESGSMVNNIDFVKDAAEQFLIRMLPADRARIGSFEDKIIISPAFTNDRDALVYFLRHNLQYGNGTALWDASMEAMDALKGLDGRRVLVLFTDGGDDPSQPGPHAGFDQVLKRAQAEGVMVYSIGFHSRFRGGPQGQMIESAPDGGLKKISGETGGGYFELRRSDELNKTFTRVIEELHSTYVLGFAPSVMDGKVHTLGVVIKQPGMVARARKSYVAVSGNK